MSESFKYTFQAVLPTRISAMPVIEAVSNDPTSHSETTDTRLPILTEDDVA